MEYSTFVQVQQIPDLIERITGRKPSLNTVHRWIRDGYRGVKLRVSGTIQFRHTRQEWVQEFLDACGSAISGESENSERVASDMKASTAARERLESRYGFKVKGKDGS